MASKGKLTNCTLCGAALKRETREVTRTYRGVSYTFMQPGDFCDECKEGFYSLDDLRETMAVRVEKKRQIDISLKE